ncbi:hypothetical protein NX786_30525 [Telluria mixta]|uniref:Uncharacterized protein n=1 Tax=Telluria mixta TaxID=34071 RepID=A0ABT2C8F1_9BURK|nr:hypothetical protein [Telluria mixta]MCS0633682.1 hypothetical protein [Telluria mixta]WEM98102.1 hypothetical protein P0M04_10395 [Telluria mixta]
MKIKSIKPRNPHAVAAKQRNAGAHGAYQAGRRQRRTEKQALRAWVIDEYRKEE